MKKVAQLTEVRAAFAVGDGVEAHQDVRQPRRPEHQRQPERERVPVVGDEAPGLEHARAELLRRVLEEIDRVHAELEQDEEGHHGRAADQQHRLDDLHPGGRDHAAEEQEREHHGTDDHDGERQYDRPKIRWINVPAPTIWAIR